MWYICVVYKLFVYTVGGKYTWPMLMNNSVQIIMKLTVRAIRSAIDMSSITTLGTTFAAVVLVLVAVVLAICALLLLPSPPPSSTAVGIVSQNRIVSKVSSSSRLLVGAWNAYWETARSRPGLLEAFCFCMTASDFSQAIWNSSNHSFIVFYGIVLLYLVSIMTRSSIIMV